MRRILSHHIIWQGIDYPLSIAEIDDATCTVRITPYEREVAGTVFISGTVELIPERNLDGKDEKILQIQK